MSLVTCTHPSSRTLFPHVIFHDNPFRALKIYLRQYYLSDQKNNTYLIKDYGRWYKVDKDKWYTSIMSISGGVNVEHIIPALDNEEACRRIRTVSI